MKIASIILTVLLLFPAGVCAAAIFKMFHQFDSQMITKDAFLSAATPSIVYALSYLVFFVLSILLNKKGKFIINIVLSGCLILIYFFTINFIRGTWLK
jgi:hypothetical protein